MHERQAMQRLAEIEQDEHRGGGLVSFSFEEISCCVVVAVAFGGGDEGSKYKIWLAHHRTSVPTSPRADGVMCSMPRQQETGGPLQCKIYIYI